MLKKIIIIKHVGLTLTMVEIMIVFIGKRKNKHRKDFIANMAKMPFVIL